MKSPAKFMRIVGWAIVMIESGSLARGTDAGAIPTPKPGPPSIEEYATIEAMVDGHPVYSFNHINYVYSISPDLLPGVVMQEGNSNPVEKFIPKKSWEIKHNYLGSEHEMTVRTAWNDSQPFLPIHLIDGDVDTVWCSWGSTLFAPDLTDARPEWIRIDLPQETTVVSVALVCSRNFPHQQRLGVGTALPKELEVKLSRDAWHWETVYQTKDLDGNKSGATLIEFDPRLAKQIWIVAKHFPDQVSMAGHSFSIGELEVHDPDGNNLALLSRGSGVTVSSTSLSGLCDRYTQDTLWGPLQYDLGNKWVRVGPDNGSFTWNYVEIEKGKLEIDSRADESITECVRNGVNVIMVLDWKGNWRYLDPPRRTNWREERYRQVNNNYDDWPGMVNETPEMFEGYLRYVEYMVRHFKDRVEYFEIGNEWRRRLGAEKYINEIFNPTYEVIKNIAPDAKIMLGSPEGFLTDAVLAALGKPLEIGVRDGRLLTVNDKTLVVAPEVKMKDGTINVQAINLNGYEDYPQSGIVLRYQDPDNYVVATYSARGNIYIAERTGGNAGQGSSAIVYTGPIIEMEGLTGDVLNFTVKIKGPQATFIASDGSNQVSTTYTIKYINDAGAVGLYQDISAPQSFDTFQVFDASGKTIFGDDFEGPDGSVPSGWDYVSGGVNPLKPGVAEKIDAIGLHPTLYPDKRYADALKAFIKECRQMGFKGKFYATEIYARAAYPPGPPGDGSFVTEMQMAKRYARSSTLHSGMGMGAGPCHPHFTGFAHPQSLSRWTWPTQTVVPMMPSACYFVWRNVATVTDDFYPSEFPVIFSNNKDFLHFTFDNGDETEKMLAVWMQTGDLDGYVDENSDITFSGNMAQNAWVIDIFNGTEQKLDFTVEGKNTIFRGMLIKDYPTFIKIQL